eukprot:392184-Pleurochrysis_carterae.AAC.1
MHWALLLLCGRHRFDPYQIHRIGASTCTPRRVSNDVNRKRVPATHTTLETKPTTASTIARNEGANTARDASPRLLPNTCASRQPIHSMPSRARSLLASRNARNNERHVRGMPNADRHVGFIVD